jgi:O-antigen ligase
MLHRVGFVFFLLFVFCSTFSIAASQFTLAISIVLTVIAAIRERFNPFAGKLLWLGISIAGHIAWLIVVCLFQDEPFYSLGHIREEWLFFIVPVGIYWMRDRRNVDRVVTALATGVILVGVGGLLLHLFGMDYNFSTGLTEIGDRPAPFHGNFAHTLTFGNYMAVAALLLFGYGWLAGTKSRRVTSLVLVGGVIAIVGVLMAGSRGPILATCLGLALLALFSHRRGRWLGIAGMLVVVLAVLFSPTLKERFSTQLSTEMSIDNPRSRIHIFSNTLEIIADNPMMGVGPGNFPAAYSQRLDPETPEIRHYTHAHNDLLQVTARSGLPGLVLFSLIWYGVIRRFWVDRRDRAHPEGARGLVDAALIGSLVFLVASFTEATFADEEVRAILMLVWAVGLSVRYNSEIVSGLHESENETEPIT